MILHDNQACTRSTYVISQRNASKTSFIFFRKSRYLLSAICKFKSTFIKQALFKPNLFGKYYFISNFISDEEFYILYAI